MKKGRKKEKKETKKRKTKEEISEIFKIEDGKEKVVKTHAEVEKKEEVPSKKQIKRENKILRNVIIFMIGLVLIFFVVYAAIYFTNHFKVDGIKFEVVKMGSLTFYKTSLPGIINYSGDFVLGDYGSGNEVEYNFYFRKDPRILRRISFDGGIIQIKKFNVINITDSFNCDGDGIIAIANLLKLYEVMEGSIIKDENASCDENGIYGWIQIKEGNETKIERFGPACFNLYVKDCEILDATERFMLETLIKLKENSII
jgi:hypothetical protein